MVKRTPLRRLFRLMLAIGCAYGVGLGVIHAYDLKSLLSFYTEQSNLLCLILYVFLLVLDFTSGNENKRFLRVWKGMATIGIILTFVVYQFVLRPALTADGVILKLSSHDFFVHAFTPLMVLLDYILWDTKGTFRWRDPLLWSLFPLAYIGYTYAYVGAGGRYRLSEILSFDYPYFFLDYKTLGWPQYFGILAIMFACYFAASYLLVWIDRRLGRTQMQPQ